MSTKKLTLSPLSEKTWADFESVMGRSGGASGCWCMHWRLSMLEFMKNKGRGNKAAMRELALADRAPGVVAYLDDEPVAWCGFGDRSDYPRMQRSSVMKPVDEAEVVSLSCLYIKKGHRGAGLSTALISAVCDHLAGTSSADWVEAYPVEPAQGRKAGADNAMTGIASAFLEVGFTEVARRRPDRPVMRLPLR
ncbi:GNAT family N-acetyltransferase [Pseudonocardia sp. TRM90224]|uniref:GNAT family N-acetyltransferase n=1 Tax=Pseudonocardia sp. TRM90224 TaxID=2812678 RepID=UPI001E5F66DE|nr:GNAT family N-acetyltransferase [Pseudonocardia sp. TRM90224]